MRSHFSFPVAVFRFVSSLLIITLLFLTIGLAEFKLVFPSLLAIEIPAILLTPPEPLCKQSGIPIE